MNCTVCFGPIFCSSVYSFRCILFALNVQTGPRRSILALVEILRTPWGQEWGQGVSTTSVWPRSPDGPGQVLIPIHPAQPTISVLRVQPHLHLQISTVPRHSSTSSTLRLSASQVLHLLLSIYPRTHSLFLLHRNPHYGKRELYQANRKLRRVQTPQQGSSRGNHSSGCSPSCY